MATKYQIGDSWYLHWREGGKQKKKSIGKVSLEEANAHLIALERQLQGTPSAGPLFMDWCIDYSHWHKTEYPTSYPRIRQIMEQHLIPIFGPMPIGVITRRDVESYKHTRIGKVAAGTVIKELRTLQAILNKAVDWEVIPVNRAKGAKPPKDLNSRPPRWYSAEEMGNIYVSESIEPYRWTWQLLANTGMRRGEALNLKWRDVGSSEIRVISEDEARTKSGKWRVIPVSDGAEEALDALKGKGFVLPRVAGQSLSRAFSRTIDRADLDGSIHCLRHTYCSHLVMNGVPLRTVQVLAGHASYTTTERYAHLAPGHLQDSVRGLNL